MPRRSVELALMNVSYQKPSSVRKRRPSNKRHLSLAPYPEKGNVLELLPPGSFVTINNQPKDLPPFQVIQCKGGRCWVRQQAWGKFVHWEVEHRRLKSA